MIIILLYYKKYAKKSLSAPRNVEIGTVTLTRMRDSHVGTQQNGIVWQYYDKNLRTLKIIVMQYDDIWFNR